MYWNLPLEWLIASISNSIVVFMNFKAIYINKKRKTILNTFSSLLNQAELVLTGFLSIHELSY